MIMLILAWCILWAIYFAICLFLYRRLTGNPSLVLTPEEMTQEQMSKRKPVTIRPKLRQALMKLALPGFMMRGVYIAFAFGTFYGLLATWMPTLVRLPNLVEVDTNRFLVLDQDKIQKFHINQDAVPFTRVDGMPELPAIPEEHRPKTGSDLLKKAEGMADNAGMGQPKEDMNAKALREALQRQLPSTTPGGN